MKAIRFLYDGVKISPDSTIKMLELQDDDIIDAMIEQVPPLLLLTSFIYILKIIDLVYYS